MPVLVVFAAGATLTAALAALGPVPGSALVAGIAIGFFIRPLLIDVLQNW